MSVRAYLLRSVSLKEAVVARHAAAAPAAALADDPAWLEPVAALLESGVADPEPPAYVVEG